MKLNIKSRKGFTLIELLVVIGILAVLAAIAIPSVAGLIDRANVSADKTNSNEMTNAIERFTSEYELYCQDIASGALDPNNLDSAQGRVKNVIGATTRAEISAIEVAQDATVADNVIAIYRDTKYPANAKTMQLVVQNYTKTSSSTFEPKQSDMHFWYSPDCGIVVVAEPNKTAAELDGYVISGKDAKGNDISGADRDAKWIDLTANTSINNDESANCCENPNIKVYDDDTKCLNCNNIIYGDTEYIGLIPVGMTYEKHWQEDYCCICGDIENLEDFCNNCQDYVCYCGMHSEKGPIAFTAGEPFPAPCNGDFVKYGNFEYCFAVGMPSGGFFAFHGNSTWDAHCLSKGTDPDTALTYIGAHEVSWSPEEMLEDYYNYTSLR